MQYSEFTYLVGKKIFKLKINNADEICAGDNVCLAKMFNDPALRMPWAEQGWKEKSYALVCDHEKLKNIIERIVKECIRNELPGLPLNGFSLEHYHKFVGPEQHLKIVRATRRIYPGTEIARELDSLDFSGHLSEYYNIPLSYRHQFSAKPQWVIIRINPPRSASFNPVHKDIYEVYDLHKEIPQMINAWIPIAGVNENAGLAIAPGSHLIPECLIHRTPKGSTVNGTKFRVNAISKWSDTNQMILAAPKMGEMLLFSSHLIHGIGYNYNEDTTRCALEFRLFK